MIEMKYSRGIGKEQVRNLCLWLEEYVGTEEVTWTWCGRQINVRNNLDPELNLILRLKIGSWLGKYID